MGVKVTGAMAVEQMLLDVEATAGVRVFAALKKGAKEVQSLAIKMAPVDEGNLEESIKTDVSAQGRDSLGRFGQKKVTVYVDVDMPLPQEPGRTVGDYAYEIHEHQTPYGPIPLGKKSQAKNDSNGGIVVGGKFMERAAEAVSKDIDVALSEMMGLIG